MDSYLTKKMKNFGVGICIVVSSYSFRMFAIHLILQRIVLYNDKYKQYNA
jgi:hypothetical protein